MTLVEAFNLAQQAFGSGHAEEAGSLCRRILAAAPDDLDTLNLLGAVLGSQGKLDEAAEVFIRLAALHPEIPEIHANLALALYPLGRLDEAAFACDRALRLRPHYHDAQLTLGNILQDQAATRDDPGLLKQAIEAFEKAIALRPDFAQNHYNLANALGKCGQWEDAVISYWKAIALQPDLAEAHTNLGNALHALRDLPAAVESHRRALELRPDYAEAHNNLGAALLSGGQPAQAIAALMEARRLKPDSVMAINNLGNALRSVGKAGEAIGQFDRALALSPQAADIASNRIFTLQFRSELDLPGLSAELARWDGHFAKPLAHLIRPHENSRQADRVLRIGLVSPDFRDHVVGRHLLPFFKLRDPGAVRIVCYSALDRADSVTEQIRVAADEWREIALLNSSRAAEMVREDRIDILLDLSLHSGGNRLMLFAHKPAPVQASHLGYCGWTGLSAIDYFLTDPFIDPPGEAHPAEGRIIRLPHTFWCYPPPDPSPPVVARDGPITFGCLNNFAKISPQAWDAWARVLEAVGESRLLVHAPPGAHQDEIRRRLGEARVEFVGRQHLSEYLCTYNRIDVTLDPFPYGGGITSCDSLWMGAPVVTLRGRTPVGRGGCGILSNLELTDLIAKSPGEYVDIAVNLAGDRQRLAALRRSLRQRMEQSPLMDAVQYARDLEAAMREMWMRYCNGR